MALFGAGGDGGLDALATLGGSSSDSSGPLAITSVAALTEWEQGCLRWQQPPDLSKLPLQPPSARSYFNQVDVVETGLWRAFDTAAEVNSLIRYLNPKGRREAHLLENVQKLVPTLQQARQVELDVARSSVVDVPAEPYTRTQRGSTQARALSEVLPPHCFLPRQSSACELTQLILPCCRTYSRTTRSLVWHAVSCRVPLHPDSFAQGCVTELTDINPHSDVSIESDRAIS